VDPVFTIRDRRLCHIFADGLGIGGDVSDGGRRRACGESETGLITGQLQVNGGDIPDPTGCLDVPGDEGCAIIAAIAVVFSLLVIAIYFIASAPTLFAEVMLDSLLVGGLYHRLRRYDESRWFLSAIRHTIIPAIILIIVLALQGWLFQPMLPKATSIGGVLNHWRISH